MNQIVISHPALVALQDDLAEIVDLGLAIDKHDSRGRWVVAKAENARAIIDEWLIDKDRQVRPVDTTRRYSI